MVDNQERRNVERIGRSEGVEVKIVECDNSHLLGQSYHCQTVDLSEGGLQLRLPEALPEASVIEICITIHGSPCKYFLKGEVRYSHHEEGTYNTGVEFDSRQTADLMSWAELFTEG